MCTPAAIPWVLGAIGVGAVVKKQSDQAAKALSAAQQAVPAPKVTPPPAAVTAGEPLKDVAAQTTQARADAKRKAAALAGLGNTMKTGGLGVPGPAPVQGKTLLGQ